jgi:cytochrome P450 family 6
MHPPVPAVNRKCVKDYKVPDEDLVIQKGTTVVIQILGIHYDAEYYPEPEKFDPDRFSDENKRRDTLIPILLSVKVRESVLVS